jgi:hypothetical protein
MTYTAETSVKPPAENGPFDPELKKAGELASPTWELELFLSGAFVFATFQLPGLIESLFARLDPHVTDTMNSVLTIGTLYAKAIAFTLIAMFSVHLGLRAYWVALMGLRSVFPGGIRWDAVKLGPIGRETYRKRAGDMSATIERIDNVCSVIFSVGLLLVLLFVSSTLMMATFGGLSYLIAQRFTGGEGTYNILIPLVMVFVGVPIGFSLWDRRFGDRYAPGSRGHRVLERGLRVAYVVNPARLMTPIMFTLMSNLGRRKSMVFLYVAIFSLILLSAADRLINSDRLTINSYDFFATPARHSVSARFYEDQHEAGKPYPRTPSIQSDVIKDPYVRLFIPYFPRRYNATLAKACPSLKPLESRGLHMGADPEVPDSLAVPVLACLTKVHNVKLDGAVIGNPDFSFYEQQSTGLKGIVSYIPVDSLARGRHTLEIMPVPPTPLPSDPAAAKTWKEPYVISFWK